MKGFTARRKQSHQPASKRVRQQQQKQSGHRAQTTSSRRCAGALCCGSRLSVSSNVSNSSSSEAVLKYVPSSSSSSSSSSDYLFANHGVPQSRPDRMTIAGAGNFRPRGRGGGGRTCILLVAVDKSSCDPKGDFRRSIAEVITSKRLEEPKELRSLLNCYMAMNDPALRRVILEAFHEVCTNLFFACSSSSSSSNYQLLYHY